MPVDPSDPRTVRDQIADDLRTAIERGEHPTGRLPSISALRLQYGVAPMTIRNAYDQLRSEGLVYARPGAGWFIRTSPPVRRVAVSRYQAEVDQIGRRGEHPRRTSFTAERGLDWSQYRLDKEFRQVAAPSHVADLLHVPAGTWLLERRFVFYGDGHPEQMSTSYYPWELVAGTAVADPANEPWPGGNIAQLATLGVVVDRVSEATAARMPTVVERRTLRVPPGVPVFAITRVMSAAGAPVEVASPIVIPADRAVLDNDIRLAPPGVDTTPDE
jgi:GntR family transcriptional regulator